MADTKAKGTWGDEYLAREKRRRERSKKVTPSMLFACLAVAGRIVVAPLVLLYFFLASKYLSTGTFFIEAEDGYFAYRQKDMVMSGGCLECAKPCAEVFMTFLAFNGHALMNKPDFEDVFKVTDWNFTQLSDEAMALATTLGDSGAVCNAGVNEWGSPLSFVAADPEQILKVIETLEVSVSPHQIAELKVGVATKDDCKTKWTLVSHLRLFRFQTAKDSLDYSSLPTASITIFPDYTDCRALLPKEGHVGSKLAVATDGDLLSVVPELLHIFPYAFTSSLPEAQCSIPAENTIYGVNAVLQPYNLGFYAGCRVTEVNTTGVYVEDTCTLSPRWAIYGLMLQSTDDIPVCSTGNVCVHNYYNTLWEFPSTYDPDIPGRVTMIVNVFRNRFADSVSLSVLPGIVVAQTLLMGFMSLYQVMSHKRSVLITQIWTYKCQNGRMQVIYLAQVTYHLYYCSDMYYLGFFTGTLSTESLANLTFSFFAFSYACINLIKARSGEQNLDRCFRLTWEVMQIVILASVAGILASIQVAPLEFINTWHGELLRKTTERGARLCGLNDSCVVYTYNLAFVVLVLSLALGFVALGTSHIVHKNSTTIQHFGTSIARRPTSIKIHDASPQGFPQSAGPFLQVLAQKEISGSLKAAGKSIQFITSFEKNCLGSPLTKLFKDCNDFAWVTYHGKRCNSIEAVLLTGYLLYGQHIYQAPSVLLLLVARFVPRKLLRTFNVLIVRWEVHPDKGTVSNAMSCTWYTASTENYKFSASTPVC